MAFNQPADPIYGGDRLQLFNVENPLTFSLQDFEAKWRDRQCLGAVWSKEGTEEKGGGWTMTYDCRYRKRHSSSKKNVEMPVEKQRKTAAREANLARRR